MKEYVRNGLLECSDALNRMLNNEALLQTIADASVALANSFKVGGKVLSCGNGGSMCDAMHFAEELSGRYRRDRLALPATAISDVGHLTCVANDYGYEHVFSRYVEAHGNSGDVLLAISTSGKSKSIINAATVAKKKGMAVVSLHGRLGSPLAGLADFDICTPAGPFADRVQECHIKVLHILIELIERQMFNETYA